MASGYYHKLKFLLTDDPAPLRALQPIRRRPRTDALWALGLLAVAPAPAGWSVWPGLGFGLAGVGLVVFGVCGWDAWKGRAGLEKA